MCFIVLFLVIPGCKWFGAKSKRETIFDKKINIPKQLVLDIPKLPPLCDEIPGLKKGYVDVKGGRLYYEEEGKGIPLVLINGGPGGTHHSFHPYFSQLKDVARIIYYDQRGTGKKSSKDHTGKMYTVQQAVEDVEDLRKALKIDKWIVLGHSYGGFLAQCYALTYPQHCLGLILVNTMTGQTTMNSNRTQMFISPSERSAIDTIRQKALTPVQSMYNQYLWGDWKRQGNYYKPTKKEIIRQAIYGWDPAPGFRELMFPEAIKIDLRGKFYNFEIPTLIVEGKWDLFWDITDKVVFLRKNHPHAQILVFEKSGHYAFKDEQEKFCNLLKVFLKKVSKTNIVYKLGNRLIWPKPRPILLRLFA